jgi:hypothetical protein
MKMYGSVKQTMEVVITSALTFLVATTVHAELGTTHMEPLAETSMSAGMGAMTAVRSVSTLLDHTTATVSVAFS